MLSDATAVDCAFPRRQADNVFFMWQGVSHVVSVSPGHDVTLLANNNELDFCRFVIDGQLGSSLYE